MKGPVDGGPELRRVAGAEYGAVLALDAGVGLPHAGPPDDAMLRERLGAGEVWGAWAGGELVGYGLLHYHFFHSGFVERLLVRGDRQRQGIGRLLLRRVAESCTSPKLWVSTNLSNTRMQALLAGEGFALSGVVDGLDPGDPELFYHKRLRAG